MNRRSVIWNGLRVAAAIPFTETALAQTPAADASSRKVAILSEHLQWLRSGDEVGRACVDMAFDALDVTIGPSPSHVDPSQVQADLPAFVNAVRGHGVAVDTISCRVVEADSSILENVLATAAGLGIKSWSRQTYRYDLAKPLGPQIDALKPGIASLARLSEKHGLKLMYRNRAGAAFAGSAIFDLLELLKDLDPRHVGFLYDTGQAALAGGIDSWTIGMRAAGPYIGGVAFSDAVLKPTINTDEGGYFTGTPEQLNNFRRTPNRVNYGGGGQANPWQAFPVPLGTGLTNLPQTIGILKDIHFQGPLEIAAEYPNGGAETGADSISLPRAMVLGAMKRDLLTLRAAFGRTGFI